MNKTFLVISILYLALLSSCHSTSDDMDCTRFKEGKFQVNLQLDGTVYLIDRKDSIQIETNTTTGNIVTSKIRWTGPCECELFFVSQTNNANDSIMKFLKGRPVKSRILKTTKDYYIFESRIDNVDFQYSDTMWKRKM